MLTVILGRVGSGKSLYAMHLLIEELRHSQRHIVTTLSVDKAKLNDYVQRKFPKEDLDVCGRIHRLTKEELRHFWRCRGLSPVGVPLVRGPFGDATWGYPDNGTAYFLDEAQEGFNARAWAATGIEFTSYGTQHRKLGDDVIAITPASGLLDKQFRMLCGECVTLENWYTRKLGWFRAPRMITWKKWLNCPPDQSESAVQSGRIYIDAAGLASCYCTEEGVGIVGRGADKGKVAKGVPWYMVFLIVLACGVGAWGFSAAAMHAVSRRAGSSLQRNIPISPPLPPTNNFQSPLPFAAREMSVPVRSSASPSTDTNFVSIIGHTQVRKDRILFFLSDGRVLPYPSPDISEASSTHIVWRGIRYNRP